MYSHSNWTGVAFRVKECGQRGAFTTTVAQSLCSACRNHRGLRHYWGLRVKGQHTKTTGRRGKTVGVAKKR